MLEPIYIRAGEKHPGAFSLAADDWGGKGLKVWVIRAKKQFGMFHWSVALECIGTQRVIVVNRGKGLDIACNKTFAEAIEIT